MFGRSRKTLDKISVGDLKMIGAEMDYKISLLKTSIKETEDKITLSLERSKEAESDIVIESIARETAGNVGILREFLEKLDAEETKKRAVQRLIALKEETAMRKSAWNILCKEIDLDKLIAEQEESGIQESVEKLQAERILESCEKKSDFPQILTILKDVRYNGEGVEFAKSDLENLVKKEYYNNSEDNKKLSILE